MTWGMMRAAGAVTALSALAFLVAYKLGIGPLTPVILAFVMALSLSLIIPASGPFRSECGAIGRLTARAAVVLLGIRVSVPEVADLGRVALPLTIACLVATYFVTSWIGKRLGVDKNLTRLIAAGTAVCGASAILAVNGTKRSDEDHAVYAVACVTVLGTVSMVAVMTLGDLLKLSPIAYGTWAGASLHEVAQVLGAAQHQDGSEAVATVVKLSRILFLPLIVYASVAPSLGKPAGRDGTGARAKLPGFIWGFLAMVLIQSTGVVPPMAVIITGYVVNFLLAVALVGLAFGVKIAAIHDNGWRPLALAAIATILISVSSLAAILLSGM